MAEDQKQDTAGAPMIETPAARVTVVTIQITQDLSSRAQVLIDGQVNELIGFDGKPLDRPVVIGMLPGAIITTISQALNVMGSHLQEQEASAQQSRLVMKA